MELTRSTPVLPLACPDRFGRLFQKGRVSNRRCGLGIAFASHADPLRCAYQLLESKVPNGAVPFSPSNRTPPQNAWGRADITGIRQRCSKDAIASRVRLAAKAITMASAFGAVS